MSNIKFIGIIILFINYFLPCTSQPNYFTTKYESGKVIFSVNVPNARSVCIRGVGRTWGWCSNRTVYLKNIGNNNWQTTLLPSEDECVTPGSHGYYFLVNGVNTTNPSDEHPYNAFDIPDPDYNFYTFNKNIPHGTIRAEYFYSTETNYVQRFFIYLPPDYDTRTTETYPVLFLQHGFGGNEFSCINEGINFTLDNLIAEGKAKSMIVVMVNGMLVLNNHYANEIINDILPLLKRKYKIKTDKMNMAVAGESRGGGQVTYLAIEKKLGMFGYIGAFNGDVFNPEAADMTVTLSNPVIINDSLILYFNGYGAKDNYDFRCGLDLTTKFTQKRVNHFDTIFPGGHETQVYRKCLHAFAQMIFKPYTYKNPFSSISIENSSSLSVYPNPFSGNIHFDFNDSEKPLPASYGLTDITGKQILTFSGDIKNAENKISEALRSSSEHLFILSIKTQKNIYQIKIVK